MNDILSGRRVTSGSGYFDVLERNFYSALHTAYYGPEVESVHLLPDRFEAEERSNDVTPQVLHLVSGRDLFGMVCLAARCPELSNADHHEITSFSSNMVQSDSMSGQSQFHAAEGNVPQKHLKSNDCQSDAYRDLELHVSGRVIATARRFPPKNHNALETEDSEDHIYVYLASDDDSLQEDRVSPRERLAEFSAGCKISLGVIRGLGTVPEEGTCYVYNTAGVQTHAIMKHRTLLVCPSFLLHSLPTTG